MARTVVDMMEDEEFEDPIPPGVLPQDDEEAAPADEGFDALLKAPEPIAPAPSSQEKLDGVFNSGPSASERLKAAHGKDKRRAALDSASDALYAAFARRPLQKISSTPSEADAVSRAYGVERLDKQDARQARLDAQAAELNKARIAKLGQGKQPGQYKTLEAVLGLQGGSLDGADPATVKEIAATIRAGDAAGARVKAQALALENQKTRDLFLASEAEKRARIMAGTKDDAKVSSEVKGLGSDLAGTAALKDAFAQIDNAQAAKSGAGIGRWDSIKPDFFNSSEDTQVKQALKQIVAVVLKKQSGATVSEDEMKRTLDAFGIGPGSPEAAFASGYAALKNAAISSAKESEAKVSPAAVQEYRKRGGVTSSDFGGKPRAAPPIDTTIPVREPGQSVEAPPEDDEYEYRVVNGKTQRRRKVR